MLLLLRPLGRTLNNCSLGVHFRLLSNASVFRSPGRASRAGFGPASAGNLMQCFERNEHEYKHDMPVLAMQAKVFP